MKKQFNLFNCKYRGNQYNAEYPIKCDITSLDDLLKAVAFDHVGAEYKDNHRMNKFFIKSNCIMMDCDNTDTDKPEKWLTPESLRECLNNVEYYIIFSRNHNKPKKENNKEKIITRSPRPKFHIYFPLGHEISSFNECREIKEHIIKIFPKLDQNAKDGARFFYGVENPQGIYYAGNKTILDYLNEHEHDNKPENDTSFKQIITDGVTQANDYEHVNADFNTRVDYKIDTNIKSRADTRKNNGRHEHSYNGITAQGERNQMLYDYAVGVLTNYPYEIALSYFQRQTLKCDPLLSNEEIAKIWRSAQHSDAYRLRENANEWIRNYEGNNTIAKREFEKECAEKTEMLNSVDIDQIWNAAEKLSKKEKQKKRKQPLTLVSVDEILRDNNISVKLNSITGKIEISPLPENADYLPEQYHKLPDYKKAQITSSMLIEFLYPLLQNENYKFGKQDLKDCVAEIAKLNEYNPFEQILTAEAWDGVDRLAELFDIMELNKSPECASYCVTVRKWLHQVIAMALNDEGKRGNDFVLVLQGAQGVGKTEFARNIALRPEWFVEGAVIDMKNKDTIIQSTTGSITEIGEADATTKRGQPDLKSFITRNNDLYRRPYSAYYEERPRRCSFVATVNTERFLNDITGGSRRWAVIKVENINSAKMRELPREWYEQLYRQIYEQYFLKNNDGYRLTANERAENERRNVEHCELLPAEADILDALNFGADLSTWEYRSATQVLEMLNRQGMKYTNVKQIGKALTKISEYIPNVKKFKREFFNVYYLPQCRSISYDDNFSAK